MDDNDTTAELRILTSDCMQIPALIGTKYSNTLDRDPADPVVQCRYKAKQWLAALHCLSRGPPLDQLVIVRLFLHAIDVITSAAWLQIRPSTQHNT